MRIRPNAQVRDVIRDLTPSMKDTGGDYHDVAFGNLTNAPPLSRPPEARADQNVHHIGAGWKVRAGGHISTRHQSPSAGQDVVHLADFPMDEPAWRPSSVYHSISVENSDGDVALADGRDLDLEIDLIAYGGGHRLDFFRSDVRGRKSRPSLQALCLDR